MKKRQTRSRNTVAVAPRRANTGDAPNGTEPSGHEGILVAMRTEAKRLRRHPAFAIDDIDDIVHDLWIELDRAMGRYDPAKSAVATFATAVIRNAATSLFRKRTAQRRWPTAGHASLDDLNDRDGADAYEPTANDGARRLAHDIRSVDASLNLTAVRSACSTLPDDIADVAMHLGARSIDSMTSRFGLTRREVTGKVATLRSALIASGVVAPD